MQSSEKALQVCSLNRPTVGMGMHLNELTLLCTRSILIVAMDDVETH